ncbi:MAG: hypothetical protein R3337_14490, partial [Gammaproteobacteria bacterium]|nr:hypothetical protein [Gammaproteobacteria bacterium]
MKDPRPSRAVDAFGEHCRETLRPFNFRCLDKPRAKLRRAPFASALVQLGRHFRRQHPAVLVTPPQHQRAQR